MEHENNISNANLKKRRINKMSRTDYNYKRQAIVAAKDFGYSNIVMEALRAAKNGTEVEHIMVSARREAR
jgi:hypothetical protein